MKDVFVGRQPILDRQQKLFAYELLFRSGMTDGFPDVDGGVATSSVLSTSFFVAGIDSIANGSLSFVNFPQDLLEQDIALLFPSNEIVIEILEDIPPTNKVIQRCKVLRDAGYRIALDDFVYDPKFDPLLEVADIVKIDFQAMSLDEVRAMVEKIKPFRCRLLAEKVETHEEFELAKSMGFVFFQGYFFARPEVVRRRSIPSNQQTMLSLVNLLHSSNYNISAIEKIIKIDVAISHKLLNFLNSAYFGRLSPVKSIKQAIVFLGEQGVRQFVTLIVMSNLTENKPKELSRLSIIRAKFLQNISDKSDGIESEELFMMGLFSLIPAMLDCSMSDAMDKLPLSDGIKNALVKREGPLFSFLKLIEDYEQLDKNIPSTESLPHPVGSDVIVESYIDAVNMADSFF